MEQTSRTLEILIKISNSFEVKLKAIVDLVNEEKAIIKSGDLSAFSLLVSKKETLSEEIFSIQNRLDFELRELSKNVHTDFGIETAEADESKSISDYIRFLDNLGKKAAPKFTRKKILDLKLVFEKILNSSEEYRFQVGENKVILTRFLEHQQSSIQFWQSVQNESNSNYDQQGKKTKKNSRSIFEATA